MHSLQKYIQDGEELGHFLDTPRREKYEKLFSRNEPTVSNRYDSEETEFITGNLQQ